jgi:hypothetical protein
MDPDRLLIEVYCGPHDQIDRKFSDVVSRVRKERPGLLDAMEWEILRQREQHQTDTLNQQIRNRWSMAKYIGAAVLVLGLAKGPVDAPKPTPISFEQAPCSDIYPCRGSYSSPQNFDSLVGKYYKERELSTDNNPMP